MEFIVLIGIMLIIFTSMMMFIGLKNQEITESMIYSDAQKIADSIASQINIAARVEGYYSEFKISENLASAENYSVVINNESRLIIVKWDGKNRMSNMVTDNVSGTIRPGINRIRNEEGMIIIES